MAKNERNRPGALYVHNLPFAIPQRMRAYYGLRPGDKVVLWTDGRSTFVQPVNTLQGADRGVEGLRHQFATRPLVGAWKKVGLERRADADRQPPAEPERARLGEPDRHDREAEPTVDLASLLEQLATLQQRSFR